MASALVDLPAATSVQSLFEFRRHFEQLHDEIYRWDMWAAAYLIGGGCSDDAFMDFRAGLITQGRDWYERATAAPDSLAAHPTVISASAAGHDEALFNEPVKYAPSWAYDRLMGDGVDNFYNELEKYLAPRTRRPEDMGEDFDFDDHAEMRARLPQLARLFLGPADA